MNERQLSPFSFPKPDCRQRPTKPPLNLRRIFPIHAQADVFGIPHSHCSRAGQPRRLHHFPTDRRCIFHQCSYPEKHLTNRVAAIGYASRLGKSRATLEASTTFQKAYSPTALNIEDIVFATSMLRMRAITANSTTSSERSPRSTLATKD